MALPAMQNSGWSRVGAEGRHRHVPSQQGKRATLKTILRHNSNESTQADSQADPTSNAPPVCQISLAALPATALASIFHHLNSVAGFKLAQTCRACATEFAHQRKDFTRKAWNELLPTVTCDPQQARSSATHLENTVLIRMKWEQNPGSALRHLYAVSQHPGNLDPVKEMWKQAWPKTLWSDLLCDGMPETCSGAYHSGSLQVALYINIVIQLASNEQLKLPWNWLKLLVDNVAGGLRHHLSATAPQLPVELIRDGELKVQVSLQRPAQANKMQEVMHKIFWDATDFQSSWYEDEEATDLYSVNPGEVDHCLDEVPWVLVTPINMQQVAITGNWCQVLPNALWPLWEARHGCHAYGMTEGDNIAVDLREFYLDDGLDQCCGEFADSTDLLCAQISGSNVSTPLTKAAGQSDWKLKRQQAKQRAKVKHMNARGQQDTACKSRSSQASVCQDFDWIIR